jgi:hypothetical protein
VALLAGTTSVLADVPRIPNEFEDAPAVMLEDSHSWKIVPPRRASYEVSQRILILDPRGFSEADRSITYDAKRSKLAFFEARTVLPDGTTVDVTEELKNDTVVFKSEDVEFRSLQFTFPAVGPRATLELSYRIHEGEPSFVRVWEPHGTLPVLTSSFRTEIKQPTYAYPIHIEAVPRGNHRDHCAITDRKGGDRRAVLALTCRNLPAFEPEPASPPEADLRLRFDVLWLQFQMRQRMWSERGNQWAGLIERFVRHHPVASRLSHELEAGASTDAEKVDSVYDWIKRNLSLRATSFGAETGQSWLYYDSVDEVIENGGGMPQEITLLAMVLLREVGVDAQPIAVADRSVGRFIYDAFDSVEHLLLMVRIDGKNRVLDPSCLSCQPGITDWRWTSAGGPAGIQLYGAVGSPVSVGVIPARFNLENRTEHVSVDDQGTARVSGKVLWNGQLPTRAVGGSSGAGP